MSRKHQGKIKGNPVTYQIPSPAGGVQMETFVPWTLVKRGNKKQVIIPLDAPQEFLEEARQKQDARESAQDTPLMRALGLAHHWQRLLDEGKYRTMTEIAVAEGIDLGQASRIGRLTQLAPDIVEACMACEGKGLVLDYLNRRVIPVEWCEQRERLLTS
ncbi:MAG: LacI family transcriptional regulator [Ferrovum myxofaciens]|uniref:hypothetical protein n=1 Tax=Ferrovum myxofaciens TaxID=416213 RepID=UPI0023554AD2|nr:hypothetical protein [Ferrovum myxofaciens]QKE40323.1 MAG: LacI family transcriptional regulator [Ferrovum myxofaciens]